MVNIHLYPFLLFHFFGSYLCVSKMFMSIYEPKILSVDFLLLLMLILFASAISQPIFIIILFHFCSRELPLQLPTLLLLLLLFFKFGLINLRKSFLTLHILSQIEILHFLLVLSDSIAPPVSFTFILSR